MRLVRSSPTAVRLLYRRSGHMARFRFVSRVVSVARSGGWSFWSLDRLWGGEYIKFKLHVYIISHMCVIVRTYSTVYNLQDPARSLHTAHRASTDRPRKVRKSVTDAPPYGEPLLLQSTRSNSRAKRMKAASTDALKPMSTRRAAARSASACHACCNARAIAASHKRSHTPRLNCRCGARHEDASSRVDWFPQIGKRVPGDFLVPADSEMAKVFEM